MRCFSCGNSVTMRCRNSDVSSSRRSGNSTPLTTMLRAMVCNCASSSADSSRPVNTTTGTSDSAASSRMLLQHIEAGHVRQPEIEHDAVAWLVAQDGERLLAGAGGDDLDIVVAEQFADAHLLGLVVLDDQQTLAARRGIFLDARQRRVHAFGGRRLGDERECAARQRVLAILVERDDLHGDMPRQRILLELAQHRPAQHVGQEHVERYRGRLELLGQIERIGAARRDQHLEALVAGEVQDDARIVRIVLDDQQDGVAGLDFQPVVGDVLDGPIGRGRPRAPRRLHRRRPHQRSARTPIGRADVFHRQIEHEGRAFARRAVQLDFAAEQVRQFAADGEAEAGAAVLAAGARRRPAGTPRR